MDPFINQLAALCRDQVTSAKWVFAPSHAIDRHGYFRPLADRPTTAHALWSTAHEKRIAGVIQIGVRSGPDLDAGRAPETTTVRLRPVRQ